MVRRGHRDCLEDGARVLGKAGLQIEVGLRQIAGELVSLSPPSSTARGSAPRRRAPARPRGGCAPHFDPRLLEHHSSSAGGAEPSPQLGAHGVGARVALLLAEAEHGVERGDGVVGPPRAPAPPPSPSRARRCCPGSTEKIRREVVERFLVEAVLDVDLGLLEELGNLRRRGRRRGRVAGWTGRRGRPRTDDGRGGGTGWRRAGHGGRGRLRLGRRRRRDRPAAGAGRRRGRRVRPRRAGAGRAGSGALRWAAANPRSGSRPSAPRRRARAPAPARTSCARRRRGPRRDGPARSSLSTETVFETWPSVLERAGAASAASVSSRGSALKQICSLASARLRIALARGTARRAPSASADCLVEWLMRSATRR